MKKVVIIHLWEGYPGYCWYPSVKEQLEKRGFVVAIPQMPEPNAPKLGPWLSTLKNTAGMPSQSLYLVGHSIGAVTILKYLEGLSDTQKIGGVILVAGFTEDMGYKVFRNFFRRPLSFENIRNKAQKFTVIISDDDPYIPMRYGYELQQKLNAQLVIKHKMKHMSQGCNDLPDVTEAIKNMNYE